MTKTRYVELISPFKKKKRKGKISQRPLWLKQMEREKLWQVYEICKPYIFMTLVELCLAVFMIILQYLLSQGMSAVVLVIYKQCVATLILSVLAFFIEKRRRPPITFKILCYGFLLGLLQITLCQFLLVLCLKYVDAVYESIGLNLQTAIIFVLAVVFGQETFHFRSINGQAKLWGIIASAAGALMMVLWTGPTLLQSTSLGDVRASNGFFVGITMIAIGLLATCFWNILVGHVTRIYPAELSLTAMMSFFGATQTALISVFITSKSEWKLKWDGGFIVFSILFGGVTVTGLSYYVMTWCIHKKGPVFTSAFSPLLIIFSFLLDTFLLGDSAHLGSFVGAVFVVVGLYLILWAKANDNDGDPQVKETQDDRSLNSPLIQQA